MLDRHSWHLVLQFALKDFKIRYTHSVLGYAWSVLNPLLFTLIYFLVFSVFIRFNVPNYPCYLLLGIALWSFFSEGSSNGVASLVGRAGIISKVAIPRKIIVYAAVLNALLTFSISLVVLCGFLWWSGTGLSWTLLTFPIFLVDLIALTLGVALLLAPLHVRFRDVGYLWGIALQILFWLTPIVYHDSAIPERWRWLITYNLMARIILYSRQVLVYSEWPDWLGVFKTTAAAGFVLAIGFLNFRRLQARVVEYL
jgi:ABC-type polysaccharide/polyol phosphate export permease